MAVERCLSHLRRHLHITIRSLHGHSTRPGHPHNATGSRPRSRKCADDAPQGDITANYFKVNLRDYDQVRLRRTIKLIDANLANMRSIQRLLDDRIPTYLPILPDPDAPRYSCDTIRLNPVRAVHEAAATARARFLHIRHHLADLQSEPYPDRSVDPELERFRAEVNDMSPETQRALLHEIRMEEEAERARVERMAGQLLERARALKQGAGEADLLAGLGTAEEVLQARVNAIWPEVSRSSDGMMGEEDLEWEEEVLRWELGTEADGTDAEAGEGEHGEVLEPVLTGIRHDGNQAITKEKLGWGDDPGIAKRAEADRTVGDADEEIEEVAIPIWSRIRYPKR